MKEKGRETGDRGKAMRGGCALLAKGLEQKTGPLALSQGKTSSILYTGHSTSEQCQMKRAKDIYL